MARPAAGRILRPTHGDYFDGVDQVTFTRDSARRVSGMLMHDVRLRKLRFHRVATAAP